jgi:hypothetical protein
MAIFTAFTALPGTADVFSYVLFVIFCRGTDCNELLAMFRDGIEIVCDVKCSINISIEIATNYTKYATVFFFSNSRI